MADLRRAVERGRTLRSQAGLKVRQPLGTLWLAMPADWPTDETADELLAQLAEELNVKTIEVIGDESDLVDRRVKPLLPVIGRKYGKQIPAIMAASRSPMTLMYSLPGPWHFSHWTPSRKKKVSSFSQSSACTPVAWQPRHTADCWGSVGIPLQRAINLASGVARLV
mgnify:CR=1 FL=1